MREKYARFLLAVFTCFLTGFLATTARAADPLDAGAPSDASAGEIDAYIQSYYLDSDIQYSFQDIANRRVDCIDYNAQWAVRHLASAGKLPPTPPPQPSLPANMPPVLVQSAFHGEPDQNGNPRQCPPGTVPKYRPSAAEITAAGGLAGYFQKHSQRPQSCNGSGSNPGPGQTTFENDCYYYAAAPPSDGVGIATGASFEHAVGINNGHGDAGVGPYWGMSGVTPVYSLYVNPNVNIWGEHADDQIWLQTGTCENWFTYNYDDYLGIGNECDAYSGGDAVQSFEIAEVSFATTESGNAIPQLWIFYTPDGYYTGCTAGSLDPGCCGETYPNTGDCWITAVGANIVPGQSLVPGYAGDPPVELGVQAWQAAYKEPSEPGWWVWVPGQYYGSDGGLVDNNGSSPIGHLSPEAYVYPGTVDEGPMAEGAATYIQAGGEVFDTWPDGGHTNTEMGAGNGSGGYKYEAYFRDVCTISDEGAYSNAVLDYYYANECEDYEDYGDIRGVCGPQSEYWPTNANGNWGGYTVDLSSAAGGSGWNTYFYFGGGTGTCNLVGGCPP